jgi:hypothetical protein
VAAGVDGLYRKLYVRYACLQFSLSLYVLLLGVLGVSFCREVSFFFSLAR